MLLCVSHFGTSIFRKMISIKYHEDEEVDYHDLYESLGTLFLLKNSFRTNSVFASSIFIHMIYIQI